MGRELRMVTPNWEHPKDYRGHYEPLLYGYQADFERFQERVQEKGLEDAIEYWGGGPVKHDYMLPDADPETLTHYMMYEDTTEGTPISPAFATPEELARWLADTGASAFGGMTASYEAWLSTIKRGSAPSAAFSPGMGFVSGVEAMENSQ